MSHYIIFPQSMLDEILAGVHGDSGDKADKAVNFLTFWSNVLAKVLAEVKRLFSQFSGASK